MQIYISPVLLVLFFAIGTIIFVFVIKTIIEHEQLKEKINNSDEIKKDFLEAEKEGLEEIKNRKNKEGKKG